MSDDDTSTGDAEDALHGHVHVADHAPHVHPVMRPRRRQVGADEGVDQEQQHHERHDPARAAAHRLEHKQDQRDAADLVEQRRAGAALEERIAAGQHVAEHSERQRGHRPVPPEDAVAITLGDREQQKHQEQHECHVDRAHDVGRHDHQCEAQVDERHHDRRHRDESAERTGELVGRALLFFDEFLGFLQCLVADDRLRRCRWIPHWFAHARRSPSRNAVP